jgi:hypothetical protein
MDHAKMGHGDMDMGQCDMNVCILFNRLPKRPLC